MLLVFALSITGCGMDFTQPEGGDQQPSCDSESCLPAHIKLIYPASGDTVAGQVTVRFMAWGPDGLTAPPTVTYRQWADSESTGPTRIEPVGKVARQTYEASWDTRDYPDGLGMLEICARSRKGGFCRYFWISIENVP